MSRKPIRPKPTPLTPAIIADTIPGEDRGDAQCPGLRVRCAASGKKRFFYRYRARDGVLREIKLGDVGSPLTLAKAREAVARKRLERAEGKDPQLEKRKAKLGCSRVVQDRILNHVDTSVSAIYDQHRYDAEARTWLQKLADHLSESAIARIVQDYGLTLSPVMVESLPEACREALSNPNLSHAALMLLQTEMGFEGAPEVKALLR